MVHRAEAAPPNSLILVVGSKHPVVPSTFGNGLVAGTSSCIAIGCKAEDDGPTKFTLGSVDELSTLLKPTFTGRLEVPDRMVALETVYGDRIVEQLVQSCSVTVMVWLNDGVEPDEVIVAVGP
jgi:hypothetical protein